ncbi:MAG: Uma2 family endonuclease, partial [Isosphaeraceae bacterium]
PRLESGDHLTASEFLERYEAMPELKKAELIDGVVYVPSPVRWDDHGVQHGALAGFLSHYWMYTRGTQLGLSGTLKLGRKNVPQPDLALIVLPSHGGQTRIDARHFIVGAPELVAEISASTKSIDMNAKFRLYLRKGVREYIVWRVEDEAIDWFIARQGRFDPLEPDSSGILNSEAFPGLWLDPAALVKLDLPRVLQVLQQGMATPEHPSFVARLAQTATGLEPKE